MEVIATTISLALLISLILSPFLILIGVNKLNIKYKLITYLIIGIIITSILTITFTWWADASTEIILSNYGYNFSAMDDTERYLNVPAENIERVKSLEISMMGIGWPIKAFITYVIYSPYLLIVYLLVYLYKKQKAHAPIFL